MSSIDDILAGYESLRAGPEAFYMDLYEHPNCPTLSTAPPGESPSSCRTPGSRAHLAYGTGTGAAFCLSAKVL